MGSGHFEQLFLQLTDHSPVSWQSRLYEQWAKGEIRSVIDLPTGLGKTMVMAIWVIAREQNPKLGRRLIYVVDRRTVVDQATDLATRLQQQVGQDKLAISTLRGQLADDREWTRDPSKPAIIIGTVDLIGSGLLFSGYRSSFKQRPLEAGLLGQDSLLVLDEAHLSRPFEKLLNSISTFQESQDSPMRVVRMSATSSADGTGCFTLADGDLTDPIVKERFEARKRLSIRTLDEKERLADRLAHAAIELAQDADLQGKRIVVYVRRPEDVRTIADVIRKRGAKKGTVGPYDNSVEVLTGTMRGLERDELLTDTEKHPAMQRFLSPGDVDTRGPCFLVSTSAGEVGFDLNADHMVCDAAPLDSMIQRLGRVNRRGKGDATVVLIKEASDKTDFDKACIAASNLLTDGMDVSPRALSAFKQSLTSQQIDEASSPKPKTVELTDILLDAWSMTSIVEPMPGRPPVGPWLRGIDEELPQTTIAWRVELDLDGFDQLDTDEIEEWFDTHRILTHETLTERSDRAANWLIERWDALPPAQQQITGGRIAIVDRAGIRPIRVRELIESLQRKSNDNATIVNAELILPASFGGIGTDGLLNPDSPPIPNPDDFSDTDGYQAALLTALRLPDIADARERCREVVRTTEDGESRIPLTGAPIDDSVRRSHARFELELPSDGETRWILVSYVPKRERPEFGTEKQTLTEHVESVRRCATAIASGLPELDPHERKALELAAQFHDHGKNRARWQRLVRGTPTPPGQCWSDQTLGKSDRLMLRDPTGYRHEFGSLREFIQKHQPLVESGELAPEVFDLAAHLIAAHHGRARPHFPKGGFDPDFPALDDELSREIPRRFARLQQKYGRWGLAWLESLLRAADAMASQPPKGVDP